MRPRKKTKTLVIGAGPVGLTCAIALAERGVELQIIDKDWITAGHSFALALHPRVMELMESLGLLEALLEQGYRVDRLVVERGEKVEAELDYRKLDSRFPFVLVVPQQKLEATLEARLKGKANVLWSHQALSLEQDDQRVRATVGKFVKESLGYPVAQSEWVLAKEYNVEADWVIGCDGFHSFTRRQVGLDFRRFEHGDTFLVFEFQSDRDFSTESRLVLHEEGAAIFWPLKGARGRWSFQVSGLARSEDPAGQLAALLKRRVPNFKHEINDVYWSTVARFDRRLVDRFSKGRVWLIGDAAHATGPAGVQSMNVGMLEAFDLARRLADDPSDPKAAWATELEQAWQTRWQRLLGVDQEGGDGTAEARWSADERRLLLSAIPDSGSGLAILAAEAGLRVA